MIPAEARVKSRLIVFGWRGNNCIAKGRARVAMVGIALTAKNSNCITRNDGNDLIALTAKNSNCITRRRKVRKNTKGPNLQSASYWRDVRLHRKLIDRAGAETQRKKTQRKYKTTATR